MYEQHAKKIIIYIITLKFIKYEENENKIVLCVNVKLSQRWVVVLNHDNLPKLELCYQILLPDGSRLG